MTDVSGSATTNEGAKVEERLVGAPDETDEVDDRTDAAIRWRKRLDERLASKKRTRI
jgi:hypothetical protein